MVRPGQLVSGILLAVAVLATSGCADAIFGVLLAPDEVVGGAANAVASSGAQVLNSGSLSDLTDSAQTLSDLDRIIKENPQNSDQLSELRNSLAAQEPTGANAAATSAIWEGKPVGRRTMDQTTHTPVSRRGRPDQLHLDDDHEILMRTRRAKERPDTLPEGSALRGEGESSFAMSLEPIRLR
ncbi:MAG: hypothetical protein H0X38_08175 [Planctomycetes bacterium]|nr:hypothetical protein [Planctomycetota bacterium]